MRRGSTRKTILLAVILLIMCFLAAACGRKNIFAGAKTIDETGFRMRYLTLDKEESAELKLTAGDEIEVRIQHISGNVDVTVGQDGEEPIYQGSGQKNAEFILTIPKTGFYQISVTGHRAEGEVSFTLAGERTDETEPKAVY